ncbi:MAG: hypothetical protein QW779_00565 [Nitrososphaerales archaeon]
MMINLLKVLFLFGFLLPTLHYASLIKYHQYIMRLAEPFAIYNVGMVNVILVAFVILWSTFSKELKSERIKTIGTFLLMICILTPSLLLLIAIFIARSMIQIVSNFYLSWIGSVVIMLPILWIIKLADSVVNLKGSVTTPINYTIAGYISIIFLNSIENIGFGYLMDIDNLSYIGLKALIIFADFLFLILNSIAPINITRQFSFVSELSTIGELPKWLIATFIITSATYFYFKLELSKDELILEKNFNRLEPTTIESTLFRIGLTILIAVTLTVILLWIMGPLLSIGLPIIAILLTIICVMEILKRLRVN